MARGRRPHPMTEGVLKEIYQLFFEPLFQYKPEGLERHQWMATLFNADHRDVLRYRALKRFKLPGLYCAAPLVRYQGMGYRRIKTGEELLVRFDDREEHVDVQTIGKWDQTFYLTKDEFESIRHLITEVHRER